MAHHSSCVDNISSEMNLTKTDSLVMCIFNGRIVAIAYIDGGYDIIRL